MKPKDIKEVLRRVDEFDAIEIGNTISNATGSHKIYNISVAIFKTIAYVQNEDFIFVDRDEYVLNNWTKMPKEALEI